MTQSKCAPSLGRRQVIAALAACGVLSSTPLVRAQGIWKPAGPVKIVLPWPPGGPTDIMARVLAAAMVERGFTAIVENRPGAAGTVGSEYVYNAAPDGTTLLFCTADSISIFPQVSKTRFDPNKFLPLAAIGGIPLYLVGRRELPAANLEELVALARRESLSCSNPGTGSGPHLTAIAFARVAKIDNLLHVPFQGAVPGIQAVIANQVDLSMVASSLPAQYRSRLKIYGGSGSARVPALADVPPFSEQGLPLVTQLWSGVLAPPKLPPEPAAVLSKMINEIVVSQPFQTKLVEVAMTPINMSSTEFAKLTAEEFRHWGEIIRTANIKLD